MSTDKHHSSDSENDENDDVWDDEEQMQSSSLKCLFSDETFGSAVALCAHMKKVYNFDFVRISKSLKLDFYGNIRLINYVRAQVKAGEKPETITNLINDQGAKILTGDALLAPVLSDDAFLMEFEDALEADDSSGPNPTESKEDVNQHSLAQENQTLKAVIAGYQQQISQMSASMQRLLLDGAAIGSSSENTDGVAKRSPGVAGSSASDEKSGAPRDAYYFDGYSDRSIHKTMLQDTARTEAYRDIFYKNPKAFEGKCVLDIGCGTGILCMFAAKAGARRVVGIDNADIIDKARVIVEKNGFSDVITLVKARVEKAGPMLPRDIKAFDFIVSEWMGYFCLFESMLPSVLYARDLWMSSSGRMLPDSASMYLVALDVSSYRSEAVDFWKDVYGFDMSPLIDEAERYQDTVVDFFDEKAIASNTVTLQALDLSKVRDVELDFKAPFALTISRDTTFEGFGSWFDVGFDAGLHNKVQLSTGPSKKRTHWKQTQFFVSKPFPVAKGDTITGTLRAQRREDNNRDYDVEISWSHRSSQGLSPQSVQKFSIKAADA